MWITRALQQIITRLITLWIVSICLFAMVNLAPGDPILKFTKGARLTSERRAQLEAIYGLDKPLLNRYWSWTLNSLTGDLGESIFTREPVQKMIRDRLKNTFWLMVPGFLISILLAFLCGTYTAIHQYTLASWFVSTSMFIFQSIPVVWFGAVLIFIFYGIMKNPFFGGPLFPAGGMYSTIGNHNFLDQVHHMILPLTCLCATWAAYYTKFVRISVLDVISQPYITVAYAKGLSQQVVLFRHILKNAASILVTLIALDLPSLFAGAFYIEFVFAWPGMGRLFQEAAVRQDYPVMMGVAITSATIVIFGNLLADFVQIYIDPRIAIR